MKNLYEMRGLITCIHITRLNGDIYECLIDTDDLGLVSEYPGAWCVSEDRNGYMSVRNHHNQKLSRLIMNNPVGKIVDHRDGDVFNNTKDNLRVVDKSMNNFNLPTLKSNNTTGVRGVSLRKDGLYAATVRYKGKYVLNTTCKSLIHAAMEVVGTRNRLLGNPYQRIPICFK